MKDKADTREKVYDILKGFSTAMLVTLNPSGRPASRPMHIASVDDEQGDIWFFTSKHGTLVEEIAKKADALLVFQNENSAYLSLHGKARIVQDRSKIQQLWKQPFKVWFPGGVDDPEVALIAVNPIDAEYWDNRGLNKLEYLFETAKAYVKGERPDISETDQHAKTNL